MSRSQWYRRLVDCWQAPATLIVVCLLISWLGNDRVSLWDRDEPRYAETARVMVRTGDYIVPYFNGHFRFQKPVLTYWLIALAYQLLGETVFAARMVAGLSLAGACLAIFILGNRMFGKPAGSLAAWMLLLCPTGLLLGKLCIPDGPQLLFGCICYLCLYLTYKPTKQEETLTGWAAFVFWLSLGLGVLIKGPILPGMIAATILVHCLFVGARWRDYQLRWRVGGLVFLSVTIPWLLAIQSATGSAFFGESIGRQLVGRAASSFDGRVLLPGYYAGTTLIGFAPWLALAVLAAVRWRREWRQEGPVAYLLAWIIGPMLLLELFRSKQIHYYAPAYPALALLAAGYLANVLRQKIDWVQDWHGRNCSVGIVLSGLVLAGAFFGLAYFGPGRAQVATIATGIVQLVGITGAGLLFWHAKPGRALALTGVTQASVGLLVASVLMPAFEPARVLRPVGERLARESRCSKAPIVLHQLMEPSLTYYSGLNLPVFFNQRDFLAKLRCSDRELITVLTDAEYVRLQAQLPGRLHIQTSWHGWVKMHPDTVHLVRVSPADTCAELVLERDQATCR